MREITQLGRLSVVYGGQWGSCGKGQVLVAHTRDLLDASASSLDYMTAVRVGAPNAGHTVTGRDGCALKMQSIPCPSMLYDIQPVIGAGGMVSRHILEREIEWAIQQASYTASGGVSHRKPWRPHNRPLLLDSNAMVVTQAHIDAEIAAKMQAGIGSTCEGIGEALAEKIKRRGGRDIVAGSHEWPETIEVCDTVRYLNALGPRDTILVEGTQGYLLSLHTSGYYPFCTSRECGPEGILADIGLTSRSAENVNLIAVFRTYPIRVGGNSGEMGDELTWGELLTESDGYVDVPERTTVTNRIRRIARWNWDTFLRVVAETRPTTIAISFLDYLFPEVAHMTSEADLLAIAPPQCIRWLETVQRMGGVPIGYISTGAGQKYTFPVSTLAGEKGVLLW